MGPYCVVVSLAHPAEGGTSSMDQAQTLSFHIAFFVCNICSVLIINYDDWQINAVVSHTQSHTQNTCLLPLGGYFYPFLLVHNN